MVVFKGYHEDYVLLEGSSKLVHSGIQRIQLLFNRLRNYPAPLFGGMPVLCSGTAFGLGYEFCLGAADNGRMIAV